VRLRLMPARLAASAIFSYEPFTTLISFSTDLTPMTLKATLSARLRSAAFAAVPHSVTLPSAAVTSIAAAWIFASPSSAFFTRAASSLFGSGFGASGAFASGAGVGVMGCGTACGAGAGAGCGLGAGWSPQAAAPSKRTAAISFFMVYLSVTGKQLCDRSRVETVLVVAHFVADHHRALFGEDGLHFLAAKTAQHVFDFRLVIGAMIFDGVEAEHPHQLFREHAREQVIGLRAACFVERQRRGELGDAVPAVGVAAVGVGELFQQQPAEGAAVGVEPQKRRQLLGLRQVVLEDLLQRLAFQRHHALVEAPALQVLERHRQATVAQQVSFIGLSQPFFPVVRHPAYAQLRRAIGDQQADRARA